MVIIHSIQTYNSNKDDSNTHSYWPDMILMCDLQSKAIRIVVEIKLYFCRNQPEAQPNHRDQRIALSQV